MKVVLFCGGLGMRLKEFSETIPKPMVNIGPRPILWNVMKYYAHYGHKDFILCLGHQADIIKNYFLNYSECLSNDFTLSKGGREIKLYNSDIDNWNITFADTGLTSNIGQRFKIAQRYLDGEDVFMANYTDGLTDLHLPDHIDFFKKNDKIGSFLSVRPPYSFHIVNMKKNGLVERIYGMKRSDLWINGGFFVFKKEIFDYIEKGEELVLEPFSRLIKEKQLVTNRYDGFWINMDTFKDKQQLDEMYLQGNTPWEVWRNDRK